jgi:hypothetical protein
MVKIVKVIFPGCQLVNYLAIELALYKVNNDWGRKLKKSSFFAIAFFKTYFLIDQVIFPGCQLVNYLAIELALCQVDNGWGRKLKKSSFFAIAFLKHIFILKSVFAITLPASRTCC